ncbi:STT3 domain-containing protein [Nitratifractor sp.]
MKTNRSDFLDVGEVRLSAGTFAVLMLIAYLFVLAIRYIWVDWASGFPQFHWNGELMINTNDGYYWGEGARDILAGHHQPNDLSPVDQPIAMLTAFLARVLPLKFETIILWMPAVFGSLLVVPVMLIGRALRHDLLGFFAAMLAGIAWSYYNRTMVGYYDTDMLTIVFPTFVLWAIIQAFLTRKDDWAFGAALITLLYEWWYPSAVPLVAGFAGVALVYTVIFERNDAIGYRVAGYLFLAATPIAIGYKGALLVAAWALFRFSGKDLALRMTMLFLPVTLVVFALFGGFDPIWYQLKGYIFREGTTDVESNATLHFYAVSKTVREAGKIPFEIFADRISGHPITFVLATIGYVMLALRYRVMWLALPMVGLGFLAMAGGLRFTVYAVPVLALGIAYLALWFARRVAGSFGKDEQAEGKLEWIVTFVLLALVLYPNIRHVIAYKVPTVFDASEVKVLDRLHKTAGREDYVLAWWDYGYPIRYYSDVKTLIDGGKHTGDVNFPVSFALTRPELPSANMARLDTEYTESAYRTKRSGAYLEMMMADYNVSEPDAFLAMLDDVHFKLPAKSREVYYYLPFRMMGIFPTIEKFSDIDLTTGKERPLSAFYALPNFIVKGRTIVFGNGAAIDTQTGTLNLGNGQKQTLNRLVVTGYDRRGKLHVEQRVFDPGARYYAVLMKNYHRLLLMDRRAFESTYVQLFVLEHYDPKLFEPVILTPMAKVYRLKK